MFKKIPNNYLNIICPENNNFTGVWKAIFDHIFQDIIDLKAQLTWIITEVGNQSPYIKFFDLGDGFKPFFDDFFGI